MTDNTSENGSLPILFYGNSYHHPDIYRSTGNGAARAYRDRQEFH